VNDDLEEYLGLLVWWCFVLCCVVLLLITTIKFIEQ